MSKEFLILCLYGRAGYEALNLILLNNNYGYEKIIVFTHNKSNDTLIDFIKAQKLEHYTTSINNKLDLIQGKSGLILSIHYRNIIRENILKKFNGRAVNLHPSLLPAYKGCFSSVWAIIKGETETGITYHELTPEVDSGNILIQKRIPIKNSDTGYSMFHKLITLGISHLPELFELIENSYQGVVQEGEHSYYKRDIPYNGIINDKWSLDQKDRFIRAMYFPPHKPAILIKDGIEYEIYSVDDLINSFT